MYATTTCTFIPNFMPNEQTIQKLWAKNHLFEGKGTKKMTSVPWNLQTCTLRKTQYNVVKGLKGDHISTNCILEKLNSWNIFLMNSLEKCFLLSQIKLGHSYYSLENPQIYFEREGVNRNSM